MPRLRAIVVILALLPATVIWGSLAGAGWSLYSTVNSASNSAMGVGAVVFLADNVTSVQLLAAWERLSSTGFQPLVICDVGGRGLVMTKFTDPIFSRFAFSNGLFYSNDKMFQQLLSSLGLDTWFYWRPFPDTNYSPSSLSRTDKVLAECVGVYIIARANASVLVGPLLRGNIVEPSLWLAEIAHYSIAGSGLVGKLVLVQDEDLRSVAASAASFRGNMEALLMYGVGLTIALILFSCAASSRGSPLLESVRREAWLHLALGRSRTWLYTRAIAIVLVFSVMLGLPVVIFLFASRAPLEVLAPVFVSSIIYSIIILYIILKSILEQSLSLKYSILLALIAGVVGVVATLAAGGWRLTLNTVVIIDLPLASAASAALAIGLSRLFLRGQWRLDVTVTSAIAATLIVGAVLAAIVGVGVARNLSVTVADMVAPELPYKVVVPGASPGADGYLTGLSGVTLELPDGEKVNVGYQVLDNLDLLFYLGRSFGDAMKVPRGVDVAVIIYNYDSPGDGKPDLSKLVKYNSSRIRVSIGGHGAFNATLIMRRVGAPPYYFIETDSIGLIKSYPYLPLVERHLVLYFRDTRALFNALGLPRYTNFTTTVSARNCTSIPVLASETAKRVGAEDFTIVSEKEFSQSCKAVVVLEINSTFMLVNSLPYPYSFYKNLSKAPSGVKHIKLEALRTILVSSVKASLPRTEAMETGIASLGLGLLTAFASGAAAARQVELEIVSGLTRRKALILGTVLPSLAAYTGSALIGLGAIYIIHMITRTSVPGWFWSFLFFFAGLTSLASLAGAFLRLRR